MNNVTNVEQLERASQVADERLDVAEDFAWALSAVVAALAWRYAGWMALALAPGVYWVATCPYRKRSAAAEDAYFRAAGLGKHASLTRNDQAG